MLLRFSVSNYLSFQEETEFNLLTGNVKTLNEHVFEPAPGIKLLRTAAIFGANGAGKSNFVKAVQVFQSTIVSGEWNAEANWRPFKGGHSSADKVSSFEAEMVLGGQCLIYGFSVLRDCMVHEWLSVGGPEKKEELIFERKQEAERIIIYFHPSHLTTEKDRLRKSLYEEELLRANQPLLSMISLAKDEFKEAGAVYAWIASSLVCIFPDTKPFGLAERITQSEDFNAFLENVFCSLDTGVKKIEIQELPIEDFLGESQRQLIEDIKQKLDAPHKRVTIQTQGNSEEAIFRLKDSTHQALTIRTLHDLGDTELSAFTLSEESDGTRRLLELIPAFFEAMYNGATVIIDEIGRSIHPVLLKSLLSIYSSGPVSGQLIFTTHESQLLDQELLRRDEIWFTEKSLSGASRLYPLSDFNIRVDLDIRKGYLSGRFGAIPFLGNLNDLNWKKYAQKEPSV